MTPRQVMAAFTATNSLATCTFPYTVARQVYKLKKRLIEELDTIVGIENAMVAKYGGESINGKYKFSEASTAEDFWKEYEAFLEQDSDIELPPVDVSDYSGLIHISATAMEALEGIVTFEKG